MPDPSVQIDGNRVRISFEHSGLTIDAADLREPGNQLAYAQLLMLQALVERQSMLASALTKLAEALSVRTRAADPKEAVAQVSEQLRGVFSNLGIPLPNVKR